tara:strand:+ start:1790 stop:2110 length:321 start_codon:yes stop_codon:yes gene_type:complete
MSNKIELEDCILMNMDLAISWNDNKQSFIPLKRLRELCPCAFCSGEKDVLGNIYKGPNKKLEKNAFIANRFEKVGHYALRIFWGDNHSDGLYTYELLRKLGDDIEN